METLAPREAYGGDELGVFRYVPLLTGVYFGIAMAVIELIREIGEGGPLGDAVREALITGFIAAPVFALGFGAIMALADRRRMDRVHAGDPRVVAAPPPGYLYRLPCGWVRGWRAVPGVLYVGARGMRFEPHRGRGGEALVIEPLEAIEVEEADVRLPGLMPMWGALSAPGVVVRWPGSRAEIIAPRAADAAARLRDALAALRRPAPSAREMA